MKNLNDNKTLTIIIVLYKESFELIEKTLEKIIIFINLERWPSGLRRTLGTRV